MFDVDWMGLLGREVLRERAPALIAEACAWAVGTSDQPHYVRRRGRVVTSGVTIGERAAAGQPISGEEDARLELGDARPGSFQDALGAIGPDGVLRADRFDDEVLTPFVLATCLAAAERARATRGPAWAELADELGEDATDLAGVVRAGGWESPLRIDAEHLVLAALGAVPLIEVEAEGLPLSLVRAAEAVARGAAPEASAPDGTAPHAGDDTLAGALFLAEAALRDAAVRLPVAPEDAGRLYDALLTQGLEPAEVTAVVRRLPVQADTVELIVEMAFAEG